MSAPNSSARRTRAAAIAIGRKEKHVHEHGIKRTVAARHGVASVQTAELRYSMRATDPEPCPPGVVSR